MYKKMKIVGIQLIVFFFVLAIQSLIEMFFYQSYRVLKSEINFEFLKFLDMIIRSFTYRASLTILPYVIFMFVFCNLIKMRDGYYTLGVMNLVANFLVVAFFAFYLEPYNFDKRIFFCTILSSLVIIGLMVFIRPRILENITR